MRIHIPVERVVSIVNLGDDGSLFRLEPEPSEVVRVPFVDALRAYCDAVDAGCMMLTVDAPKEQSDGNDN